MAQLRFEVHRALPVLKPGSDGEAVVTEVARLAVSGRAGAEVVQVTAPDITDVTSLGVRASDGGSIYRPPHEERYCTLAHLDTEEQILTAAKRTVPQLVSHEQARAAAGRTGLNGEQRDAVVMMLTAADGDDGADRPGRGGQEPHDGRVRPAVDLLHRPAGHRADHLDQRRPGAGARGPGRELQHRRIPRQDRRLRRAAQARPAAPRRRARPGRGQPAQHGRPGHDRGSGPAGRGPDHRHRRHRAARRGRSRGNVPPAGPRGPRRGTARGPPVRGAVGAGGQRPAPRRRPGRGRRLRPARPHPGRR